MDLIGEALSRRFALADAYRYASLLVSMLVLLALAAGVAALRPEWRVTRWLRRPFVGEASESRSWHSEVAFILVTAVFLAVTITAFTTLRTTNEYRERPLGDAAYYSAMALFFREPASLHIPVPTLHGNRILPSALASLIAGDTFDADFARYEAAQGPLDHSQLVSRWLVFEEDFDPGALDADANAAQLELLVQLSEDLASAFRVINFGALLLTLVSLLALLRHLGTQRRVAALVAVLFVTLFVPVRLFAVWPQQIDPTATALTFALTYSIVARRRWLFVPLFAAALLTRESLLVFAPVFGLAELAARAHPSEASPRSWLRRFVVASAVTALCVLPGLLIAGWLRLNPVFPLQGNIEPPPPGQFIEMRNLINVGTDVSFQKYSTDSSFVFRYYWDFAWSISGMVRALLLTPANTLGVLFLLPLLRGTRALRLLRPYWYLVPLVLAGWFASPTLDRHLLVAAPVACILTARLIEAERASFSIGVAAACVATNLMLNRVFEASFNPVFQQVEYFPGKWVIPSLMLLAAAVLLVTVASRHLRPSQARPFGLAAVLGLRLDDASSPSRLTNSGLTS